MATTSFKSKGNQDATVTGSELRVAIVHARWNSEVITPLVEAAQKKMLEMGVKAENITIESVPGSYELPYAVSRLYSASQVQASTHTSATSALDLLSGTASPTEAKASVSAKPFDAIIAIGVLIKGSTMHFEYICDSVTNALMKLQLDMGIPVIFGVLTCLTEEQALQRAGISSGSHNHGSDWGEAAVEMGFKSRLWSEGKI
ncbi:6,7-dimethyl-8-ribityllumazine synthase [Dipodascopsis tothii]|uniref:6,7-dimethyl-8-ribityllumazine synthase n=1 Tax=Dipodascopsis tothii TaxID=44089 RepID=UPI0034CDC619